MVVPIIAAVAVEGAAVGAAAGGAAAASGAAAAGGAAAGASAAGAGGAAVGAEGATAARSTLLAERHAAKQAVSAGPNFSPNASAQAGAQQSELSLDTGSQWRAQGQRLRINNGLNVNQAISEETGIPEELLDEMQAQDDENQQDSRQSEEWNDPVARTKQRALDAMRQAADLGSMIDKLPVDLNAMLTSSAQGATYMDVAWMDGGISGTTGSVATTISFVYSIGVLPQGITDPLKKSGLGKFLDMGSFWQHPTRYTSGCISLLIYFAGFTLIIAILLSPLAIIVGITDAVSNGGATGTTTDPIEQET